MAERGARSLPYPAGTSRFRVFRSEERLARDLGQALRDSISMARPYGCT